MQTLLKKLPDSLDLQSVRGFSALLLELNDPGLPNEGFFDRLIEGTATFIPHSSFWVMGSDLREGRINFIFGPWREQAINLMPAFGRHAHEHPQFMALCQGASGPVDTVSDYVGRRHWRSTGMFSVVSGPIEIEDQMSASVFLNAQTTLSLVVNRAGWGFTPRERTMLALLAPHVVQAWRTRFLMNRLAGHELSTMDGDGGRQGCRLMVDSLGNIVEATDTAMHWLERAFHVRAKGRRAHVSLPEPLLAWLRGTLRTFLEGEADALSCKLSTDLLTPDGRSVHIRLATSSPYGLHCLVLEMRPPPGESAASRLRSLGLSPRQAEVLYWVSQGKTNEEVAGILEISLFTVKAHMRGIMGILMVENRQTAAAMAWDCLNSSQQRGPLE